MDNRDKPTPHESQLRERSEVIVARMRGLASPQTLAALSPADAAQMLTELHLHQIELELANEELHRAHNELDAARARYFDLYDTAPVGYCTFNERGLILEANLTAATLLGRSVPLLANQPLSNFIFSADQDVFYLFCKELWETRKRRVCELQMLRAEVPVWVNLEATTALDIDGTPVCRVVLSEISDRKLVDAKLHLSDVALKAVSQGVLITGSDRRIMSANDAFIAITGYSKSEIMGQNCRFLHGPDTNPRVVEAIRLALETGTDFSGEILNYRKDGTPFWNELTISPVRDPQGHLIQFVGITRDVTQRKQAEEEKIILQAQLLQAQKMESVGRLAGGVAHDFNNMLGVILGHADFALQQVNSPEKMQSHLLEIRKAAERSADLTRQLLAFARKQIVVPTVLDLNFVVGEMLTMLPRLLGVNVQVSWQPGVNLGLIKMDRSQIEQILTNLCVNARDAIVDVGKITIETANSLIDAEHCNNLDAMMGKYVCLTVSDNGSGMDQETLSQIFEPFFTTKGIGEGTGLGLATVYGSVKQNDGFITVSSEPKRGTRFEIYLPRHFEELVPEPVTTEPALIARGHETILLVEDEPAVLELTTMLLTMQGYTVLTASTPTEATRLAQVHTTGIHLLLTDVIIPDMNGRALAKLLRGLYPGLKTLFMSGYTNDVITNDSILDEGVSFIQKPFSVKDLAAKVREVLDNTKT